MTTRIHTLMNTLMKASASAALVLALGACGLGETAATGAGTAAGKAEEIRRGQAQIQQVQQQLDQINAQAAQRLQEAERTRE